MLIISENNFQLHKIILRFKTGDPAFCDKIKDFHPKCACDFLAKAQ